tara:strand:+ start:332 stop:577 length:246 start_codon:yes stop_codon:yes gene_type:complete
MEVRTVSRGQHYSPGDLVVFLHGRERWDKTRKEIGWVVRRDFSDETPAVFLGFPGSTSEYHYFDLELREWEKAGDIEVKRG